MIPVRAWVSVPLLALLASCGGSHSLDDGASPAGCSVVDERAQPVLAADGRPRTIPALREWHAGTGTFRLCEQSRVLIAPESEDTLRPVAALLAQDFASQTGRALRIAVAEPSDARAGDFSLSLGDDDPQLGMEGYRLTVGDAIAVSARDAAGASYGAVSLLQLLAQAPAIPHGEALDWPHYPERGLTIDVGRKFFTPGWLQARVRELAWLKLNFLHLHFSDNEGFRIASTRHPEIVSDEHLTQAEIREIVDMASARHIAVVGEIDMPGHMGAALAPHPEFQLRDTRGTPAPNLLDITNPAAVAYAKELIEEFLPLFPSAWWYVGGDEYMPPRDYAKYPQLESSAKAQYGPSANAKDAVIGFLDTIAAFVRERGRRGRAWNDGVGGGSAVSLDTDVIVEWWTDFSPLGDLVIPGPQSLLDAGYTIMNASYWPTYYTVGAAAGFPEGLPPRPDNCAVYGEWEVHQFTGPLNAPAVACLQPHLLPSKLVAPDEPRNLGAKLHVWCDTPEDQTQDEIAAGIFPRLRWMAQKTWDSPKVADGYAGFEALMEDIGPAPGDGGA